MRYKHGPYYNVIPNMIFGSMVSICTFAIMGRVNKSGEH